MKRVEERFMYEECGYDRRHKMQVNVKRKNQWGYEVNEKAMVGKKTRAWGVRKTGRQGKETEKGMISVPRA